MGDAAHRFDNDLRYRDGSHPNQTAFTPEYVLAPVRTLFDGRIGYDPCTTPDNPTDAEVWYAPPVDGLAMPWGDKTFVNPPYGRAREPWVARCVDEGARHRVVLLIPAHTDTRVFQRTAASADGVLFVRGRLKFGVLRPNRRQVAASHPSALFGWNVDLSEIAALGVLLGGAS